MTVAQFFKNRQFCVAELRTRTHAAHGTYYSIIIPPPTRFACVYYVLKRLLFLRTILKEITVSSGFEEMNFSDADQITAILDSSAF